MSYTTTLGANVAPVKFEEGPYKGTIRCSRCGGIWTPGTVAYGIKGSDYYNRGTLSGTGLIPIAPVPENECPGCGAIKEKC